MEKQTSSIKQQKNYASKSKCSNWNMFRYKEGKLYFVNKLMTCCWTIWTKSHVERELRLQMKAWIEEMLGHILHKKWTSVFQKHYSNWSVTLNPSMSRTSRDQTNGLMYLSTDGVVKEGRPKFNPQPGQGLNPGRSGWQPENLPNVPTSHTHIQYISTISNIFNNLSKCPFKWAIQGIVLSRSKSLLCHQEKLVDTSISLTEAGIEVQAEACCLFS